MTAATREALRSAVSEARRAQIEAEDAANGRPLCTGCGVLLVSPWTSRRQYVEGCRTCQDRRTTTGRRAACRAAQLSLEAVEVA